MTLFFRLNENVEAVISVKCLYGAAWDHIHEQLIKYLIYKDGMFDLIDLMKQMYLLRKIFSFTQLEGNLRYKMIIFEAQFVIYGQEIFRSF